MAAAVVSTAEPDKEGFCVYPETNSQGAVFPDKELQYLCQNIEDELEDGHVDDYSHGMYTAMIEFMLTPAVKLREKFLELFSLIQQQIDDDKDDEDMKPEPEPSKDSFSANKPIVRIPVGGNRRRSPYTVEDETITTNLPVVVPPAIPEDLTDEEMEQLLDDKELTEVLEPKIYCH